MTELLKQEPPYFFEDFPEGRVFAHHWGRTITESDAITFATQTHLYEPALFNWPYAAHLGHDRPPVSGLLVYAVVLGLTVEDLSESGGAFLGSDDVRFEAPVYAGDTLYASSGVVTRRASRSKPGWGVVRWRTVGVNQTGEPVIGYTRSSLVRYGDTDGISA